MSKILFGDSFIAYSMFQDIAVLLRMGCNRRHALVHTGAELTVVSTPALGVDFDHDLERISQPRRVSLRFGRQRTPRVYQAREDR